MQFDYPKLKKYRYLEDIGKRVQEKVVKICCTLQREYLLKLNNLVHKFSAKWYEYSLEFMLGGDLW